MSKLTIYCENDYIDGELLAQSVFAVLKQKVKLSAEISFCTPEEIRELNNEQRGKDAVTDVLSFPSTDITAGEIVKKKNYPFDIDPENGGIFLGSIIICVERAKEQAEEYGHSLAREISFLTVHSCLHLLGYDHETGEEDEKEMFGKQEEILNMLGQLR